MISITGTITNIDDYKTYAYTTIEGYEKGNDKLTEFTVMVPGEFREQVNLNKKVEVECSITSGFNGNYAIGVIEKIIIVARTEPCDRGKDD